MAGEGAEGAEGEEAPIGNGEDQKENRLCLRRGTQASLRVDNILQHSNTAS
jgi:hypothetical protein